MQVDDLIWTRAFNWGVLLITDSKELFEPPDIRGGVAATSTCVAVPVRHAQDVDLAALDLRPDDVVSPAYVTVRCTVGRGTGGPFNFEGSIACPTGRLSIGDADDIASIDVPPGEVRIAVACTPARHAESVAIRITAGRS